MKPINVSVDLEANAVYVRYRHPDGDIATFDVLRDAQAGVVAVPAGEGRASDPMVMADRDSEGNLVGIELVGLDAATVRLAADYLQAEGITGSPDLAAMIAALKVA